MSRLQEQDTQLRSSRAYSDAVAPGVAMESPTNTSLLEDLDAIRSLLKRHNAVAGNWYDAVLNDFGLTAIHNKQLAFQMPILAGTSDFTLSGVGSGVLLDNTMFDGAAGVIAVGPSSVTNNGYLAAAEAAFTVAGTLGVGLSVSQDANQILLNKVQIINATTNQEPVTGGGETIFGLLHVLTGTADGASIAAAASENLQISFAFVDGATDVITATTLPAATYQFAPPRQQDFFSLTRGTLLTAAAAPGIVTPGSGFPKLPFKEFDITSGGAISAGDPLNINTGLFTGAGARTSTVSSDGTIALPASGAAFRDDSRITSHVNGQLQAKNAVIGRDVYWVSATQIAFNFKLKSGNTIYLVMPDAY